MKNSTIPMSKSQQGSTLIIVVVLLLLATLIVLFAVNLGALTQRSSGNDLRARLVQQTADSALSQAAETVLANNALLSTASNWQLCGATDLTFPCGAVPAARRSSMYRFIAGTQTHNIFADTTIDNRLLNNDQILTNVNNSAVNTTDGFNINYGVGVVMCRLTPAAVGVPPTCSTNTSEVTRIYAVTLVAVAAMPNEGARATAVKSFATGAGFGAIGGAPPIVASGLIDMKGTLQIVTSYDAAGGGGAVSVWTRKDIDPGGTPDSCLAEYFYTTGTPTMFPSSDEMRCDTCSCPTGETLTRTQGNTCTGGTDLLYGGASDCGTNKFDPTDPTKFPCDLFEYVFGVSAWRDLTSPADNFCETKINVTDSYGSLGADEAFLLQRSSWIISSDTFGGRLSGDARVLAGCGSMVGKSGIIWDRTGACANAAELGTIAAPVLLVYDGTGPFHANVIGLLFARTTGPGPLNPATGGTADLQINANLAIYGSVVVQGEIKANGTSAVIHSTAALTNLFNNLNRPDVTALPGSWSDNVRY